MRLPRSCLDLFLTWRLGALAVKIFPACLLAGADRFFTGMEHKLVRRVGQFLDARLN